MTDDERLNYYYQRTMNTNLRPVDTTKNQEGIEEAIQQFKEKDVRRYPLRLNRTTVIYVKKENRTPAYAEKARKRLGLLVDEPAAKKDVLNEENLRRMYLEEKLLPKQIAEKTNVSIRTVYNRLQMYEIKREAETENKEKE